MKLKRFLDRFDDLYRVYVVDKRFINKYPLKFFIGWTIFLLFFIHGASLNDYFAYRFINLRFGGRKEYITYRRFNKILKKCNNPKSIRYFRDKSEFNSKFSEH